MTLSPGSEHFFEEVLGIASEDPALALRVIQAANSPLSAPRTPVDTLQGAVARLGANHIGDLVTSIAIARVFIPTSPGQRELWLHAVEVAYTCRAITEAARPDGVSPEHAYLSGLLHDIGRFILFDQAPEMVGAVDDLGWATPDELLAAERAVCGTDHAELGARLCNHWAVPDNILHVVREHHQAVDSNATATQRLTAIVQVADRLSLWRRATGDSHHRDDNEIAHDIAEHCLDTVRPGPAISAAHLATLIPTITRATAQAARHLALTPGN